PLQVKRIGSGINQTAETRTAAAESRTLHEMPIGVREIDLLAVGIGEQVDGRVQLLFQFLPRTHNLFARFDRVYPSEIDVRAGVGAELESPPLQRPDLIPRHPRVANALLSVPPRYDVGSDPLRHDKERGRETEPLEHRRRIIEVVAVAVVEG